MGIPNSSFRIPNSFQVAEGPQLLLKTHQLTRVGEPPVEGIAESQGFGVVGPEKIVLLTRVRTQIEEGCRTRFAVEDQVEAPIVG